MTSPTDAVSTGLGPTPAAPPVAAAVRPACPSCGAATRPGSDWCSLCYADLRPVPPPRVVAPAAPRPLPSAPTLVAPGRVATSAPSSVDPGEVAPAGVPVVPCTVCGGLMRLEHDTCPHCGSGMFDGLRSADVTTLIIPVVGDLMRFGRGARSGIMLGIALAIAILVVALISLLG